MAIELSKVIVQQAQRVEVNNVSFDFQLVGEELKLNGVHVDMKFLGREERFSLVKDDFPSLNLVALGEDLVGAIKEYAEKDDVIEEKLKADEGATVVI